MGNDEPKSAVAQANNVTFELHTLGWEGFQNLCGHVIRETFGQTATVFSPTNDAGQDGAFQGVWETKNGESFSGRFVIQCKFTARRDEHLSLSNLKDEIAKAEKLAIKELSHVYILITNAKVSGESDNLIRDEFKRINGIKYFEIFGVEWLTQQILTSNRLRAFVPRVYGLGDLSQILDERVYRQSEEILRTWKENLAKFVPTEAHSQSVKALLDEGFVLLLGDPMAGKSTIAASLALAAADQWKCIPVFVTKPDDFTTHWNPNEPRQFFWVDDVFGQTQLDSSLVEGWNRIFPHLNAALRKGARVLFTSRTYIYNAAKLELKQTAFPSIIRSNVTIHVEKLNIEEKQRILYNHPRLGTQSVEFRSNIKKFLPMIASNEKFFPEVARRLGDPFFTKGVVMHELFVKRFVEEPKEFLCDVVRQLNRGQFATLALLFMRGGRVLVPPEVDADEVRALSLLGADVTDIVYGMRFLEGSLVSQAFECGEHSWKFRHPSIRDAMAILVAERAELVDVYLAGVKMSELLREVVCGDVSFLGAKVNVPNSRIPTIVSKLLNLNIEDWRVRHDFISFLGNRCSDDFLEAFYFNCSGLLNKVVQSLEVWSSDFCLLIWRLHKCGLLEEDFRVAYINKSKERMLVDGECVFLRQGVRGVLSDEEAKSIKETLESDFIPYLDDIIDGMVESYDDPDEDPSDYFDELRSNIRELGDFFEDEETLEVLEEADSLVDRATKECEDKSEELKEEKRREEEDEEEEDEEESGDDAFGALIKEYKSSQAATTASQPKMDDSMGSISEKSVPPRSVFDDVDQ